MKGGSGPPPERAVESALSSIAAPAVLLGVVLALLLAFATGASAAPVGAITEFPVPSPEATPQGIAAGPDANMWFTEFKADRVGRITPGGAVAEFGVPTAEGGPTAIAAGPDGNLWFTENGAGKLQGKGERIGRITPAGAISEFVTRSKESAPEDITAGPDGNMWFTESRANRIGRITPAGEVAEFPTEHSTGGIAAGSDGNLWFTEPEGNSIGRITPTGTITEFPIPAYGLLTENSEPEDITPGPDGNLWFTEARRNIISRISPSTGVISQFPVPTANSGPQGIAAGPDGNVWFTEFGGGGRRTIGRITPSGAIAEFQTTTNESGPFDIAPGPDGNLWITERSKNNIGVIISGSPPALLAAPAIIGGGLAATPQSCTAAWSSWALVAPSQALYAFDGYRWVLDGSTVVAAGQVFTPTAADVGHSLVCVDDVTYPLPFFVTVAVASAPVTVVAPPPTVTGLTQSHSSWREGGALALISRRRHRSALGTTFSFVLNEPAGMSISFTRGVGGRRVGRNCVAQNRRNARRRSCVRQLTVGRLSFAGHIGRNNVLFQGRVSRATRLKPGRYTAVILATNLVGLRSAPRSLSFTIVTR